MNVKKLLSHFIPFRKYELTTEKSVESVMRTMSRICKNASSEENKFRGKVFDDSFRICLVRDCQFYYRNPPILIGRVFEKDGKTTMHICARMTLFTCFVLAMFVPLLLLLFVYGVIAMCAGAFADALPAILISAFFLVFELFSSYVFVQRPADRAIKRLSHLLFAEVTSRPVEE